MDSSLERIKCALQHEDVEGLIELGAPGDEYDTEAVAVFYLRCRLSKHQK